MRAFLIVLSWSVALLLLGWMGLEYLRRSRSVERIRGIEPRLHEGEPATVKPSALATWLDVAGLRNPNAAAIFVVANLVALALGAIVVFAVKASGVFARGVDWLTKMPAGIGDVFVPILYAAPWILFAGLVLAPTLYVRARRRKRVREIEQDLPMVLELFATLAESGLSFDASLTRILDAQPERRALAHELRTFQLEVLAGTGRVACLRRLARRIALGSVSIFVSALVQAEQVGAGFADVLRRQADDLRSRRSERANVLAQALPVKLVFPLILCFLPMIFVSTLGPAFHQFFELASNVTRHLR